MFTAANWFMTALFVVSTVVQYNDPDPVRWMLIYGSATVACVQFRRHRRDWLLPLLVGLAALAWAGATLPVIFAEVRFGDLFKSMSDKGGSAEVAREFTGLLIVAGWMALLFWAARRRHR
ncbi:MAG TPA: transmembrane 220 family protein [Kofleriaceae bacterium]|nr:transmembrane 220 family protein [Kofleriaceae bacterium]